MGIGIDVGRDFSRVKLYSQSQAVVRPSRFSQIIYFIMVHCLPGQHFPKAQLLHIDPLYTKFH